MGNDQMELFPYQSKTLPLTGASQARWRALSGRRSDVSPFVVPEYQSCGQDNAIAVYLHRLCGLLHVTAHALIV